MISLIRSELYKMKCDKTLPVLCLFVFAICALSAFATSLTSLDTPIYGYIAAFYAPINSMYLLIIISVLSSETIAAEYSQGLMRNMLITDKKRRDIFMSKQLAFYVKTLLFILFSVSIYTIIYTVAFGWGDALRFKHFLSLFRLLGLLALFVPFIVSAVAVASFLFRNAVATIGLCAGLAIEEIIVANVLDGLPGASTLISLLPVALSSSIIVPNPTLPDAIRALTFSFAFFIITSVLVAWCSKGKKLSEVQVNPFSALRFVLKVKKTKKEQDHQT
ncbi:MAG: ABC transporter permease [Clostridiales bacterium]|jgi:ABC-2 type transport system permease protein|nr:ABC transporter permease [Clostridiales bacterium]